MKHVRVKICGITNARDAVAAVDAGADALGFVFFDRSARCISFHVAAEIVRELPPFIAKVGVFVDPAEETVREAIQVCGIDTLQFHGGESPAFCERFGLKTIKAFRVRGPKTLEEAKAYPRTAWLLDSHVPNQLGGTGETFDWELAREATKFSRMVILAGGLTAENVAQAVQQVRPYAIDVSSGVESEPGKKDHRKLTLFVTAAHTPATHG